MTKLLGPSIELVTDLDAAGAAVLASPGQLGQILMNLVVNAREAMQTGGTLTIATSRVGPPSPGQPGAQVVLEVSDTGIGMNEETMARIFEPLFTTRSASTGTGLGLASVRAIVHTLEGTIEVDSAPGRGTTFRVELPMGTAAVPSQAESVVPSHAGTETVLLVEDNELVRLTVGHFLDSAGYTVLVASDPAAAVDLAAGHDGPIHLALADLWIRTVNDGRTVEQLAECRPEMALMYMSVLPRETLLEDGRIPPEARSLEKPFTSNELLAKVREQLDDAS